MSFVGVGKLECTALVQMCARDLIGLRSRCFLEVIHIEGRPEFVSQCV